MGTLSFSLSFKKKLFPEDPSHQTLPSRMKSKNFSSQYLEEATIYFLQVFKNCQMHKADRPGEPFYLSHHPQSKSNQRHSGGSLFFQEKILPKRQIFSSFFIFCLCLTLN